MRTNRIVAADCRRVAEATGLPVGEVSRAITSFFQAIIGDARVLPFDNRRRIYTYDAFAEYEKVWNVPSLGRMGPSYSRYLKWRANEAGKMEQANRESYRKSISRDEIETMAAEILSGKTPSPLTRKKGNELYDRIWLVGKEGKRQAHQVIPKKK